MKKGIGKTISVIAILTMTFQLGMPIIPVSQTEVLATNETTVEQQSADEQTEVTEEISRNYEIKEEETWDISANGDGSIIAKWTLDNKTLTISGTGEMQNWTWNSTGDWHDTQYTNVIEKVVISNEITNIGNCAFYKRSYLESIDIPSSITSIGFGAFSGCSSLESINIPEGVTSIESSVFRECSSLESINIPEGVTRIGDSAFEGCSSLENINIPEGITSIEDMAFYGCSSLTSINIPEGVTSIESSVFIQCTSLESINVDIGNEKYMSENGILFNKEKTILICYPAGKKDVKEYSIPDSVINIEFGGFYQCNELTSIYIPEGVTNISQSAFNGCNNLEKINIPDRVTNIDRYTFYKCNSLKSIDIPEGVTSIGDSAFGYCSNLISINISQGVTSIGFGAFSGCSSLKSIAISEGVTSIGSNAISESTIIYTNSNSEGHRYAEDNKQAYVIDDEGPIVTFAPNGSSNPQKGYTVGVNVEDNQEEVGVKDTSLKYQWTQSETEPTKESFIESFEKGQTITKNTGDGVWYLWVYAEDNVGNETITRSEGFNFDNTAPNGSIEYSTKNLTKENVIVTIASNEEIQEVEGWTLSSDKKVLIKEYSANTKETITIKDLAGNEAQANIEISNIDKIAPNMNVEYSTKNPTNKNVTVTITSNEEIQEVEGWTLSSDKRVLTKKYDENTKETITIKDLAGNEAQANIEITNIDNTLPEITIGDINQDEKIDLTDLLMLKRHLVAGSRESWKLVGDRLLASDMNEDGNVDITDMLMLKRIIVEDM